MGMKRVTKLMAVKVHIMDPLQQVRLPSTAPPSQRRPCPKVYD